MVQVMIKIVQNSSLLRVNALEWYPKGVNQMCNVEKENTNGENKVALNDNVNKMKEWNYPRRTVKPNNKMKCEDKENTVNIYEILSDDDDDDTEEDYKEE